MAWSSYRDPLHPGEDAGDTRKMVKGETSGIFNTNVKNRRLPIPAQAVPLFTNKSTTWSSRRDHQPAPSNNSVEKYRSILSGNTVTIWASAPRRSAAIKAARKFNPELGPTGKPLRIKARAT